MAGYRERYERMSDDELIRVALTTSLMPEAEADLKEVLAQRGIGDLAAQRTSYASEASATEVDRCGRLRRAERSLQNGVWFGCIGALAFGGLGLYDITVHDPKQAQDSGALWIAAGIFLLVATFILRAAWLFLLRNIFFRRPPM